MKLRLVASLSFLGAASLLAGPAEFDVPQPHGWVGTTSEWMRGVGLLLAALNLVLLVWIWRYGRTRGVNTTSKGMLLGGIFVLPVIVVFLATAHGMQESMTVKACGDCHAMTGHVADLTNPKSESLAAVHYKNRYIQDDQCYTCHSDYGMYGTISAKLEGLGHVYHNLTDSYEKPIKIRKPYSNVRCFGCHYGAQNFIAKHDKDEIPNLVSGKDSCLDCHGPAHTPEEAAATKQASK